MVERGHWLDQYCVGRVSGRVRDSVSSALVEGNIPALVLAECSGHLSGIVATRRPTNDVYIYRQNSGSSEKSERPLYDFRKAQVSIALVD